MEILRGHEVIGRCGGDGKNPNDHAEPRRLNEKTKQKKNNMYIVTVFEQKSSTEIA